MSARFFQLLVWDGFTGERPGWYWQDDDCEEPMGPFSSRREAAEDFRGCRPVRPGVRAAVDESLDQLRTEGGPLDLGPRIVGTPVSMATPNECVCPTCKIFECEPGAMCPRCTLVAANRSREIDEAIAHAEAVHREITERDAMLKRAEGQVIRDARMIQRAAERRKS